jgi:hypothetical protein
LAALGIERAAVNGGVGQNGQFRAVQSRAAKRIDHLSDNPYEAPKIHEPIVRRPAGISPRDYFIGLLIATAASLLLLYVISSWAIGEAMTMTFSDQRTPAREFRRYLADVACGVTLMLTCTVLMLWPVSLVFWWWRRRQI